MLRTVRAARYVLPFREGGSVPALVEGDDLGLYVVKLRGAAQGEKALIAELISGELGRAMGLPIPELVAIDLHRDLAAGELDPEINAPLEASAGINIGMDFLPGSITYDPIARFRPDSMLAARTVVFDSFVANVDRTPRNTNLLVWHKKLWLIDHGASLYFHHGWEPKDRLDGSRDPFTMVRHHVLMAAPSVLAPSTAVAAIDAAADHLKRSITAEVIQRIANDIPETLLDRDASFPDVTAHRMAYRAWLEARLEALPIIVEEVQRARAERF